MESEYGGKIFKVLHERNIAYITNKHDDHNYMISRGFTPYKEFEELYNHHQYLSHGAFGVYTLNSQGNCVMKEFRIRYLYKVPQGETFISEVKCMNELQEVEGVQKLEMVTVDTSIHLLKTYTNYCGMPFLEFFENTKEKGAELSIKVITAMKDFCITLKKMKNKRVCHTDLHCQNLTAYKINDNIKFNAIDFGTGVIIHDDKKLILNQADDLRRFCDHMLTLEREQIGLFDDAEKKVKLRSFLLEVLNRIYEHTCEELEEICNIYLKINEDETNTEGYLMYNKFRLNKKRKKNIYNKQIIKEFSNLKE